jgi:glycosyltransferase involved in cell wall biosynthesis
MTVVQVSKNDMLGGAARAAYRLHQGLRDAGHDSRMLVVSRSQEDPAVIEITRHEDLASRVLRGLRQYRIAKDFRPYEGSRPDGYELFTDDRSEYDGSLLKQIPECDVVNLHWVSGFLDYESFFRHMPRIRPIVWTLHDMNPFTGGCHYNLGCDRYLSGCSACPQLGSAEKEDLSSSIWRRKNTIFSEVSAGRLNVVAPSRWLASEAKGSPLLGRFSVTHIPYGLDVAQTFVPRNRAAIRELLGIPKEARVVLFLAETTNSPRKGLEFLVEGIRRSVEKVPELFLLSLGNNKPNFGLPVPWLHLGPVANDIFLSMVYSAADLYVICSVQDNLPNTVLEAMACGVPVVGVHVGGIPDMVRNDVNGLTVPVGDAEYLSKSISLILNNANLRAEMGAASRRIATDEYSLDLQARRYAELYQSLS